VVGASCGEVLVDVGGVSSSHDSLGRASSDSLLESRFK